MPRSILSQTSKFNPVSQAQDPFPQEEKAAAAAEFLEESPGLSLLTSTVAVVAMAGAAGCIAFYA